MPVRASEETPYGVTTSRTCCAKQTQFAGPVGREAGPVAQNKANLRDVTDGGADDAALAGRGMRAHCAKQTQFLGLACETKPILS